MTQRIQCRIGAIVMAGMLSLVGFACDDNDKLRNIERGRDTRPAIDASPPAEAT
ncbi:MAG: hypothetical protein M3285_07085 [Actinomycetota bacterium]|nr:hypothetical protein [Actinomycetota bacterium]